MNDFPSKYPSKQVGEYYFRVAEPQDNSPILSFIRNFPSDGNMQIAMDLSPNVFCAKEVEGKSAIIICEHTPSKKIVGMGQISQKECFINGEKTPRYLGYMSGLRSIPEVKGSTLLARAYKFTEEIQKNFDSSLFLTTILEENHHAIKTIASNRANLPKYNDWGRLHTLMIKMGANSWKNDQAFSVTKATVNNIPQIIELIGEASRNRQFMSFYSPSDFLSTTGLLRDLDISSFYLIWRGQYSSFFKIFTTAVNIASSFSRYPRFPSENEIIDYRFLTSLAVVDNDSALETLLHAIWQDHNKILPAPLLMIALHERDPLLKTFKHYPHFDLKSRLYVVHSRQHENDYLALQKDLIPTVEVASM